MFTPGRHLSRLASNGHSSCVKATRIFSTNSTKCCELSTENLRSSLCVSPSGNSALNAAVSRKKMTMRSFIQFKTAHAVGDLMESSAVSCCATAAESPPNASVGSSEGVTCVHGCACGNASHQFLQMRTTASQQSLVSCCCRLSHKLIGSNAPFASLR